MFRGALIFSLDVRRQFANNAGGEKVRACASSRVLLVQGRAEQSVQGGYTILLCALIGYWFDDTTNQKTVQNKDDQIPYSDWFKEIRMIKCLITK